MAHSENVSLVTLIDVEEELSEVEVEIEQENSSHAKKIRLSNVRRAIRNWRKCLACEENRNLHRPSKKMRLFFCKSQNVYIQDNDRVCNYHSQTQNWHQIRLKTTSIFSAKIVDEMVKFLIKQPQLENLDVNFDAHIDIGLTNTEFKQVIYELGLPENPNKSQKKIIMAVKLYIQRLRHGFTFAEMARQHNINKRTIGENIRIGRYILLNRFVPNHLGHETRTRQWLIDHTTDFARLLYCGNSHTKCVFVCDGTYIYTCGSSNYAHQRQIYSGQKRRHLFKIMKIVSVDGTIIDVFGPYPATKNDSEILKEVFEQTSIENMFNAGDIMLVDRGFRDCTDFLQNKGLDVKIPEFIQKGQNGQLTTLQANKSRQVTKMRFVIETSNGRMKSKWHLFGKIIPSILTPHLMADYKIGAALLNAFAKPIICDKVDYLDIGSRMLNLIDTKNLLQPIIKSHSFQRTKKRYFHEIDQNNLVFPQLNEKDLKNLSLGTYSIKQAVSYVADHVKAHGKFEIFAYDDEQTRVRFRQLCATENFQNPTLLLAQLKSRFRGRQTHDVYVLYDAVVAEQPNVRMFYMCECQHGLRTVGCCSHVMAVVWYFGYGRYTDAKEPASHLNNFFNRV